MVSQSRSCVYTLLRCFPCYSTNKKLENEDEASPKTVNIVVGFFFLVNYQLGMGFLGIPFSFFHGGLLAGALTLLVAAFVSWNAAIWVLEVMARAQAILDHSQTDDISMLPNFTVLHTRKIEIAELCGIFLGRWSKYVYLLLNTVSSFLVALAFSTVAGSSWAVNLPLNFADVLECNNTDFHFHVLPIVIPCRNAYWFCLFLFGCIVVPLSLIKLRDQAIVQVTLGLFRFISIGAILVFCVSNLITVGNICTCKQPWQAYTNVTEDDDNNECNINSTFTQNVTHFNVEAWTVAISVMVAALNVHAGIPFLTHPVKQKKHLGALMNILFLMMTSVYMILGVVVPMWWKNCINETCTLNWDPLTHPSYSLALRVLSYYIILFPSVDVVSAFPLTVLTIVNNLFVVFTGKDSAQASKSWTYFFILFLMKFVASLLPILVAMGVSNLVTVLKYTGFMSFILILFVPALLQLRSQWVCWKTFKQVLESGFGLQDSSDKGVQPNMEERSLLIRTSFQKKPSALYMTPYSNIFSYWPAVVVIGVVDIVMCVLAVASFFFNPGRD